PDRLALSFPTRRSSDLVGVPADFEDADSLAFQLDEALFYRVRHRHHLPRHGTTILQACGAHLRDWYVQSAGDLADEVLRTHVMRSEEHTSNSSHGSISY